MWNKFRAETRYDYGCLGNLTMEEQVIEEGIRRYVRCSYNKNGWRVRKEEWIQGNGEGGLLPSPTMDMTWMEEKW